MSFDSQPKNFGRLDEFRESPEAVKLAQDLQGLSRGLRVMTGNNPRINQLTGEVAEGLTDVICDDSQTPLGEMLAPLQKKLESAKSMYAEYGNYLDTCEVMG